MMEDKTNGIRSHDTRHAVTVNFPQKVKFSVFSFGGLVELSYLCAQYNPKNEE